MNGEQSCYHQTSALSLKIETMTQSAAEFEISPLLAEFENVPEPQTFHFIQVEHAEDRPSKIHMMSFLCSGEHPIGADAYSETFAKLVKSKEDKEAIEVTIANGQATDHLTVNLEKKAKAKVYFHFLKLFEDRNGGTSVEDMKNSNIFIPNIILESNRSMSKQIYSTFFSRTNSGLNGCSKDFQKDMQDLLIENVIQTKPFNKIEIRKKLFNNKFKLKLEL